MRHSGGQNQHPSTKGRNGYVTPTFSGVPNASVLGTKSLVAHKWADGLRLPYRLGGPQRFRAGDEIKSGNRGGRVGDLTPAIRGVPNPLERGTKSVLAHKWADCLQGSRPCGDI